MNVLLGSLPQFLELYIEGFICLLEFFSEKLKLTSKNKVCATNVNKN
jgi:hypothetical protein